MPLKLCPRTCKAPKKGQKTTTLRLELEMLEADLRSLSSRMADLHEKRKQENRMWEDNLRERERAIEAFQSKEFIEFALSSAQTAQQITRKEEEVSRGLFACISNLPSLHPTCYDFAATDSSVPKRSS